MSAEIRLFMTQEQQKNKRYLFLEATLHKYLNTEPKLTIAELAFLLCDLIGGEEILKAIKKEISNKY